MEKIAQNIYTLCEEFQSLAEPLCAVSLLVMGIAFLIPTDATHNFAKKIGPFIAIGLVALIGASYLGKEWAGKIVF